MRRAFDVFGNLRSVSESTGSWPVGQPNPTWGSEYRTRYTYDVAGRLLTLQDHASNQTALTYDLFGLKTSMTDPDMGVWSYAYDAAGNLTRQTDARGCVITFSYDGLNRAKNKTYSGSSGCSATAVGYTYDSGANGKGRRTGMSDGSGSTSWTYDARGRMTQESKVISGTPGGTFVTQWGYDSADRPVWMKYPGGSAGQIGEQVNYAYTTQGLLDTVQSNGGVYYVGKTQYNERGQVAERWLGSTTGVVKQLYAYSAAENFRLVSLKAGTSATNDNLQNISYTYDDAGNVLTISDAAAYGGSQALRFTYDGLDRLLTACTLSGTTCATADGSYGSYSQRSYAYDKAGNLINWSGVTFTYQNAAHKHAVTHVGGTTASYQKYWYDANGNATRRISGSQDVTLTGVYPERSRRDAENRLTAMSGGVTASYVYDGDGNRVKETIAGITRVFVGNTYEVDNGMVKKYYYAGSVRVAENSGGALYYLLTDHLGSTALTLDSAGNRLSTNTELRYYPWGGGRYAAGATPTSYNFTGQRKDGGSGLLFYNARWYDPTVGRFLQADTIVPQPGNPQNLNRYSYALNNALRYTDPSGHYSDDEIQQYLKDMYHQNWESYWKAWLTDPYWIWVLHTAQDGYLLHTDQGGNVTFNHKDGSFTLDHGELHEYQGKGVYGLYDNHMNLVKDGEWLHYGSQAGTLGLILQNPETVYYQPLYDYSGGSPVFRAWQKIQAQWSSQFVWTFGSGEPWLLMAAGQMLSQWGQTATAGSFVTGVGSGWGIVTLIDAVTVNIADGVSYSMITDWPPRAEVCSPPQPIPAYYQWPNPNGVGYPAPRR